MKKECVSLYALRCLMFLRRLIFEKLLEWGDRPRSQGSDRLPTLQESNRCLNMLGELQNLKRNSEEAHHLRPTPTHSPP